MPADYEQTRDENIARYGWDTAVHDGRPFTEADVRGVTRTGRGAGSRRHRRYAA